MEAEPSSVSRFREYLRCNTAHPNPDFTSTLNLLQQWAKELNLHFQVQSFVDKKPIVILTWFGKKLHLPSIILNSHMDVVPVQKQAWSMDPFGAFKKNGKIYARGAQDMKCVGIQYLEAIRNIISKKDQHSQPNHTFYLTFMPDEEIGGYDGMVKLVQSDLWKQWNPAFLLDEGLAYPNHEGYSLFYGERVPWWVKVKIKGTTGHGSQYLENTAGPKLHRILSRFQAFRNEQLELLQNGIKEDGSKYNLGEVITINLTMLHGGVQYNVLPDHLELGFDIRIPPSYELSKFKSQLEGWCLCEPEVEVEYIQFTPSNYVTSLDKNNQWYQALVEAATSLNLKLLPSIFPASTDARFVRQQGIPALGISPMRNTPILLHCNDEYLDESVFLEGIEFYTYVLEALDRIE